MGLVVPRAPFVRPLNVLEPCPCGRATAYRDCCRRKVTAVRRRPPGAPTGFGHPRCYARVLCDCSAELSREHVVPAAILRRLTTEGTVNVTREVDPHLRKLTPTALAARVLCTRHNNALSDLDQVGTRFFLRIEELVRRTLGHPVEPAPKLFNGSDLERFFLKVASALVVSGWNGHTRDVPREWCEAIWADGALIPPNGLYLLGGRGDLRPCFSPNEMVDPDGRCVGVHFNVCGVPFLLCFDVTRRGLRPDVQSRLRPTFIIARAGNSQHLIELAYEGRHGTIVALGLDGVLGPGTVPDAWR